MNSLVFAYLLRGTDWRVIRKTLNCFTKQQNHYLLAKWLNQPWNCHKAAKFGFISLPLSTVFSVKKALCRSSRGSHRNKLENANTQTFKSGKEFKFIDIWNLIKPHFGWLLAAILCALMAAFLNVQIPILLGKLINTVTDLLVANVEPIDNAFDLLKPTVGKLLIAYASQAFLTFMYISFITILGEKMSIDLRIKLFNKLLHQDMSFYDVQQTGELNACLTSDVQEFKSSFKTVLSQGLKTIMQTGCSAITLYIISPKMTAVTLTFLPILIGLGSFLGSLLRELSQKAQTQNGIAASVAEEAFSNIRTVRAFAMEENELMLFEGKLNQAKKLNVMLGIGIGAFQAATNLFLNGIVLVILAGGTALIMNREIEAGDLMSFLVTTQNIQRSLGQLSIIFGQAVKGWTAGMRVFEFMNVIPTIPSYGGAKIPFHSFLGEISFQDVKFSYPSRKNHQIFNGLNLTIKPGKIYALCGPSGEGKSTIIALLERFYTPSDGRILIDGRDIRELDASWLRRSVIGLISQEPVLFATTIEENIRYGRPEATFEEIRNVARIAHADDFISNFPNGYQTIVGERGVTLSGGQKQRIAIARALLKNPPILVLDEATSALDAENERLIQDALNKVMKGRTVIIIAHRFSTIKHADCIAVVRDKRVVEEGSHDELIKKKGVYYKLIQAQYKL